MLSVVFPPSIRAKGPPRKPISAIRNHIVRDHTFAKESFTKSIEKSSGIASRASRTYAIGAWSTKRPLVILGMTSRLNPVIMQVMPPKKAAFRECPPIANLGAKALEIVMAIRAMVVIIVSKPMSCCWKNGNEATASMPVPPEIVSISSNAEVILALNAIMISNTKTIKPVMAK